MKQLSFLTNTTNTAELTQAGTDAPFFGETHDERPFRRDDSVQTFTAPEDLAECLADKEGHTETLESISVCTVKVKADAFPGNYEKTADADTADPGKGTCLFIEAGGRKTGVRACCVPSLFQRAGISGPGLMRLDADEKASVLNTLLARAPGKVDIRIVDGKANFLASANGTANSYAELLGSKVLEAANCSIERNGGYESFRADESYSGYVARWEGVSDADLDGEIMPVSLMLSTSEVGEGSVTFSGFLTAKPGVRIPAMTPIRVEHKNHATFADVTAAVAMTNAALSKGLKTLMQLKAVTVSNPKGAMKRMAKKAGLPKGASLKAVEDFLDKHGSGPATALELYIALCGVQAAYETQDAFAQERILADIRKMMIADWEACDLPGDYAW